MQEIRSSNPPVVAGICDPNKYWARHHCSLKLASKLKYLNYEIFFLFHLQRSFCSRDIQIFVFLSSPLFLSVSHCFRGWSKINLKVYDIINYLNKNLITHFVWYLGKEKRYDIETLSIDRVLNKEHFYGKVMQKMCTKS